MAAGSRRRTRSRSTHDLHPPPLSCRPQERSRSARSRPVPRSDPSPAAPAPGPADWCGTGGSPARCSFPGDRGFLGRLAPEADTLTLRAAPLPGRRDGSLTLGYLASHGGRDYVNPTLVLRPGQRVRIDFDNALDAATIVHWHGLAVDTRNDGAGLTLAAPGGRYAMTSRFATGARCTGITRTRTA